MKYEILLITGFVGFQPRTRADNTLLVTALTVQIAPKFELGLLFKERLAHGTIKTTRIAGGLLKPYKGILPASA